MTLKVCISTDLQGTFYAWNTIVFKCELYKSYTKDYQGLKNVIISSKFLPLFKYASMMVSTSILRFCFYKSSSFSASLSYRSCSFDISDFTLDISFSIASIVFFLAILWCLLVYVGLTAVQQLTIFLSTLFDVCFIKTKRVQDQFLGSGNCMIQFVVSAVTTDHFNFFKFTDPPRYLVLTVSI